MSDQEFAAALQYRQAGRVSDAEQICHQILTREPNNDDAWHLLGMLALESGRHDAAATYFQRAVALKPDKADSHNYLGVALHMQGKLDAAIGCYWESLQRQPNYAEAFNHLGNALGDQGKLKDALGCYLRAVQIAPNYAEAHSNLGTCFLQQNRFDDAVASFRRAVELSPNLAEAHNNLGGGLQKQQRLDEAAASYRRALELNPNIAAAHTNLGDIHKKQGNLVESIASYRRALSLRSNYADAHFGLGQSLIMSGDFENGWPEYEWWRLMAQSARRSFEQPRWAGEPLEGKTILAFAEQGFGDTFQFIRYADFLKERGANVVVECQKQLTQILASGRSIDRLIAEGNDLPTFDYQVPLMSLPRIFKTNLVTIPRKVPYLFPDPALVTQWREKLDAVRGFRVGINWHGREGPGNFRHRDIPFDQIAPLAQIPGVKLISLQKGAGRSELRAVRGGLPIIDPGEFDAEHGAFMDTAAIMMNLDLVVTSDTAIPHLAGALAVPVWMVLPYAPDWRWLLDRSDSPWYPTMRLFRQKTLGDWSGAIAEIQVALQAQIHLPR